MKKNKKDDYKEIAEHNKTEETKLPNPPEKYNASAWIEGINIAKNFARQGYKLVFAGRPEKLPEGFEVFNEEEGCSVVILAEESMKTLKPRLQKLRCHHYHLITLNPVNVACVYP